jgi:hypothetical protein
MIINTLNRKNKNESRNVKMQTKIVTVVAALEQNA